MSLSPSKLILIAALSSVVTACGRPMTYVCGGMAEAAVSADDASAVRRFVLTVRPYWKQVQSVTHTYGSVATYDQKIRYAPAALAGEDSLLIGEAGPDAPFSGVFNLKDGRLDFVRAGRRFELSCRPAAGRTIRTAMAGS